MQIEARIKVKPIVDSEKQILNETQGPSWKQFTEAIQPRQPEKSVQLNQKAWVKTGKLKRSEKCG